MDKNEKLAKMISLVMNRLEELNLRIPYCGEFKDEKSLLAAESEIKKMLGINDLVFYVFTHKTIGGDYFGVNSKNLNVLIIDVMKENRVKYSDKLIVKTTENVIKFMKHKVENSLQRKDADVRSFVGIKNYS